MESYHSDWSHVRVAVTGATGFVGSHLVRRLQARGATLSLLVRNPDRLDQQLAQTCRVVHGDLLDRQAMEQLLQGASHVVHCAANVATWSSPHNYQQANVEAVRVLLDALQARAQPLARLVHVSTLDVYGFPEQPASEAMPLAPVRHGYGETKRQGELLLQQRAAEQGLSYTILRPGNIVGPGSPFVSRIGEALRSGPMLSIDGGRAHAGLLDIENLLDVMLWAARHPEAHQQVYNVRDPWDVRWADYLKDFRQASQLKGLVLDLPYPVAMAAAHAASAPFRWLGLQQEPLLHPLIVQIFGRTCGHDIGKLRQHGAPLGRIDYASSLRTSLDWLAAQPFFQPR